MKKIKRFASLALSMCLALSAMSIATGCSSSNGSASQQASPSATFAAKPLDTSASIEPTTLVDDAYITVVAESLAFKNDNVYITLSLTNKTSGELDVICGSLGYDCNYINDYMMNGGYFTTDLEAGATTEEETFFNGTELAMFGISKIEEIGLGLSIKDSNYKTLFQGPTNIKTSLYDTVDEGTGNYQAAMQNGALIKLLGGSVKKISADEVFSQDGVRIISETLATNADDDPSVLLQVANDSKALANVRIANITVNGESAFEGSWSSTAIVPGKEAIIILNLKTMIRDENKERFDLGNVHTVTFELEAKDADGNTSISSSSVAIDF